MPALITGAAGFIGFHLARRLLADGWTVAGLDGLTDYYDVGLKRARLAILASHAAFSFAEVMLEDAAGMERAAAGRRAGGSRPPRGAGRRRATAWRRRAATWTPTSWARSTSWRSPGG